MSTTESPAPKSRGRHRANRSASQVNLASPPKPQFNNTPRLAKDVITPPQSPKAHQSSPTNVSTKKNKRKSKPRPRDVDTDLNSNNHVHHGYDSPTFSSSNDESNAFPSSPTRGVLNTPTKAYAGPNFHSSPNPASLPVPSWFSKSVPATPSAGSSLQAMLELSEETLSHSLEEPESHLQKLFRADKEEKAKRASGFASMPTLPTLASVQRRPSPDSSDSFPDVFTMDTEKRVPPSPPAPINVRPQTLFHSSQQLPKLQTDIEARKQADALRFFLNQPGVSPVEAAKNVNQRPLNQPAAPSTPANRRPSPQHASHSAPRAQYHTPSKKPTTQPTFNSDRQPHFIMTAPRAPKNNQSGVPQTPSPAREYKHFTPQAYPKRNEVKTDSVIQLNEMEVYLRRVLKLESRAIATPAAAS